MTMPSTAPSARMVKPSLAFADDDDEDAFSKLAASSRQKPGTKLPPVEPKPLSRPPAGSIPPTTATGNPTVKDDDGEDDYMSMTVADPSTTETALQRLKRRKLEASIRGHPLSKAELAEKERQKRDLGLSTSILDNTSSKGLKMMKAMGYATGSALGKPVSAETNPGTDGRTIEPIKPVIRESRTGIGHACELKRKFGESATAREDASSAGAKRQELSPESYRNRLTQEAQQRRYEAQLFAAQSICEKLVAEDPPAGYDGASKPPDDDQPGKKDGAEDPNAHPDENPHYKSDFFSGNPTFTQIKQINLIYRGLLYRRALSDLKARLRKEQNEAVAASKSAYIPKPVLPTYNSTGEFSEDDRLALSLGGDVNLEETPLEEEWEDVELEEFEKREVKDRLDEIVRYLRTQWRYCFWCKFRYSSDEELERDCPGPTEEDHD
ncbi:hypothetical protein TWF696_001105 [Orbilia brochopaga]|uniref:G-patch domain-containing protein n=1 Tax=Orbilia brochopaga TaxID=3140254 RepID=A0AAV9VG09_9PEZI